MAKKSPFHGLSLEQKIAKETENLRKHGIEIKAEKDSVSFDYNGGKVVFNTDDDSHLFNMLLRIDEIFAGKQYSLLKIEDKVVVDVGAYEGDSALFFAMNGAKHVYSFEPYPYSYKRLKKNVESNGLQEKITAINKGGGKDGWVRVRPDYRNVVYSELRPFRTGKKIETLSLESIVKNYDIPNGSKLKVDCEGCEVPLILNSTEETLSNFDRIIMEYHYGFRKIVDKLDKSSFNVWCHPSYDFYNPEAKKKHMVMGYILGIFVPEEAKKYKQGITILRSS